MKKETERKIIKIFQVLAGIAILCIVGLLSVYALGWAKEIQTANQLVLTDNFWGIVQYSSLLLMVAVATGIILVVEPLAEYVDKHCKTMGVLEYIQKRNKSKALS